METNDPSGRLTAEDLSDCISDSSHSESQLRAFQSYERIKELNLSIDKTKEDTSTEPKDFHLSLEGGGRTSLRFDEFSCENPTRNLTMTLNKTKDFGYSANNLNEINYPLDRLNENEESSDAATTLSRSKNSSSKNVLFNLRETKQRSPHASLSSLDRYSKDLNFVVEKEMKDFGLLKNYNLDRMKEFNFSLDRMRDSHISSLALERLRGGAGLLENPGMLEHKEFRNLQVQPRNPDLETIALERMRRSHLLGTELSAQSLSTQVPHPHSITHMQHSQQQQQQQAKSFTIDAILGLRNNQREKRNQQQQYRKHQGQEGTTKNSSSSSGSGGGGKVKRVRTIFTAEQLERLEGEFARQQYMVGPERLYLAHALRLTEAQVKVWFQNRRIKWRKLHHEQQSQRVHEFQRTLNTSLEHEDSNETDKCYLTKMEQIGRNKTKYTSPYTSTWSTKQTTDARVPPDAYWKYPQRNNQDTTDKNTRRHQNPISEPTVSYYSSANSYKTLKHNTYPRSMHLKYPSALTEAPQRYQQSTTKSGKNKDYANNIAVANKDRYKNRQEDDSNVEYIDEELGNFTEDNLEDDAEEEAENDQERVGESLDKEYDEQEADDEIDEESDAPAEPHVMQRNAVKKDASPRTQQRVQIINQQQNPHRIRYSQYSPKLYQAHPLPTRYYRNIPDRDIHEALSEEDLYTAQALKNPPRRSSAGYHQNWIPQRNSTDRYDTITSPMQSSRRAQTRPEIKSFTEAEFVDRRKCSRCGNVSIRKLSTPKRNNCRFQDNPNFSMKGHFGDDAEIFDQSWCGYCKPKYHIVENMGPSEIPSPTLYSMKTRRSRDIPMYETLEGKHAMDELSHKFARISSRYTKDAPNILRDRTRHSAQTAQGATRMSVHYDA